MSSSSITIAWTDNSSNETAFKVERASASAGPWTQIGLTTATGWGDSGLPPSTTFYYRVRASNTAGDSGYSNTASASTMAGPGGPGVHLWSTDFGGPATGVDSAKPVGIVADSTGASVILGSLNGSVNFGGGSLTSAGGGDIYLVKYSATGGYLWSKRFGGSQDDVPKGIAIDSSGEIVITGFFVGSVDFGGGALPGTTSGSGFLAKYSTAGQLRWSKRLTTGSVIDEGTAVGVDAVGNLIVAAGFYNTVSFGGASLTSVGSEDIALIKYDSAGGHVWSKRMGGAGIDAVRSLAVDQTTGEIVTVGFFAGSVDLGGGSLTSAGANDAFVARYNSSGTHTWSKRWGSTAEDKAFGLAVDRLGDVVVTGMFTDSVDFGGGPISVGGGGGGDIFLVKISSTGVYRWSKGFGSLLASNQSAYDVAVDGADNILLTGSIVALTAPYTVDLGGGAITGDGYANTFIAKYRADGSHTWSKRYLGGNGHAAGIGIAADGNNNVLTSGFFDNSVNLGGTTLTSPGGSDTFLVKLGP